MSDEANDDVAEAAFSSLQGEVAALGAKIDGLRLPPDYSPTFDKLRTDLTTLGREVQRLGAVPMLQLTPAVIGEQIDRIAATALRPAQVAAEREREAYDRVAQRFSSARKHEEQNGMLRWIGGGGIVGGIVLAWLFTGLAVRSLPASWHAPEAVATWVMGMERWDAGTQLMANASPASYTHARDAVRLVSANAPAITACRKAAVRRRETVACTIRVGE